MIRDRELYERMIAKTTLDGSGCLIWTGAVNGSGYGCMVKTNGTTVASRVMYENIVGSIPSEMQLDHLCRNRACIRPRHLEPVTQQENMRRGSGNGMALFQYKCQDPTHTRVPRSGRESGTRCKECLKKQNADRMREWTRNNPDKVAAIKARHLARKESGR